MKRKTLTTISLVAIVTLLLSACSTGKVENLSASGTFSAIETNIASQISGNVVEIDVKEGDSIKEGQVLFKIEDDIVRAQYDQATAAVKVAQAAVDAASKQADSADVQYRLNLQGAIKQEVANRQAVWGAAIPDDYRPAWYFNKDEAITAAQTGVDNAQDALTTALSDLEKRQKDASSKDFLAAETRLAAAQNALTVAKTTLDQANKTKNKNLEDSATELKNTAQAEFQSALSKYQSLLTSSAANAIVQARSRVAVAQTNLDNARNALLSLQTGDQSLQVIASKKASEAAADGLKQAQAAVEQAQQAQNIAQLQLDRTTVKSPVSGVVLTSSIEVGDLAVAGGTVMRIAQLDTLDLVVYLPEDKYGSVKLGDTVSITVDSFAGETFQGNIVRIADEAEFTPKNVQTESGRKATVYAVKIQVKNPDHRLKPGMPADVNFTVR